MKISSRLSGSLSTLTQVVMPLAATSRIEFLESLRTWYLLHLAGIHRASDRGDGLRLLLDSPLDEIPVTKEAVARARLQIQRYTAGDLNWTTSAVDALITEICVARDWNACCDDDQFDLEYVFDSDCSCVLKICSACGSTFDVAGKLREKSRNFRIASRSELKDAGLLENDT